MEEADTNFKKKYYYHYRSFIFLFFNQILSAALTRRYIRDIMKKSSGFSGHSVITDDEGGDLIEAAGKG